MKRKETALLWIKRAESNLARASAGKTDERILFEDLCFDCQQAVEKSLKALLVLHNREAVITHSIGLLLSNVSDLDIEIPEFINASVILTDYAVQTRYPGFYEPVTNEEYQNALQVATPVVEWITKIIQNS